MLCYFDDFDYTLKYGVFSNIDIEANPFNVVEISLQQKKERNEKKNIRLKMVPSCFFFTIKTRTIGKYL